MAFADLGLLVLI